MKRLEKMNDKLYIIRNPYKKYPDMEESEWPDVVIEIRTINRIIDLLVEKYKEAEVKLHYISDLDDIIRNTVSDVSYETRDGELSLALGYGLDKYIEHRVMMRIRKL